MKTIIAALMFVSTSAFAQMTIQPERVLSIDQVSKQIRSISIDASGAVIVIPRYNRSFQIFKLSPTNKREVLAQVNYLSDVELVNHHSDIVCMMMPDLFTTRTLSLLNKATGEFREILSPRGCSYTDVTLPKNDYQKELAEELLSKIIVLTNQQLNY